jgi:hypothetical protein
VRRVAVALLLVALVLPAAALSAGEVKRVDATGFPRVDLTVVAPSPTLTPPVLKENGRPVAGLHATNLGRSKSLVACIDRSQSMAGQAIVDATTGARSFIAGKTPADRVAVCAFGSESIPHTRL